MKVKLSLVLAFVLAAFPAAIRTAEAQSADLEVNVPAVGLRSTAAVPLRLAERAQAPLAALAPSLESAAADVEAIALWNRAGKLPAKNGFPRQLPRGLEVRFDGEVLGRAAGPHAGGLLDRAGASVVWGGEVRVADAWRVRLHLADVQLPAGSLLWVYTDEETVGPFGMELRAPTGEMWTPSVSGGVVRLEVRLPAGAETFGSEMGFTLDRVMEIFRLDRGGAPLAGVSLAPRNGHCIIDSQCNAEIDLNAGTRDAIQQAIGLIEFVDGGSFICSGGLLNDLDMATTIPWFLTANHCFDNQAAATSAEVFWDYYTASCNGPDPNVAALPRSNGATLISTNPNNDHTLILLNSIPANRALLGWNANTSAVPNGTVLYRFSHPNGEPQRYSRNRVNTSFPECLGGPRPDFLYETFNPAQGDKGGTFGGSSGSPVLLPVGQTVGQLTGGCPTGGSNPFDGCDYGNGEVDGAFSSTFDDVGPFLTGTGGCVPGPQTLCLRDNRFEVEIDWRPRNGTTGPANVVPGVTSSDSGLFYFVNPNNWEFLLKVLNGCGLTNHYWVFFAATTNVEFTVTVTDTQEDVTKTYTNLLGHPADAITDTSAFATCP